MFQNRTPDVYAFTYRPCFCPETVYERANKKMEELGRTRKFDETATFESEKALYFVFKERKHRNLSLEVYKNVDCINLSTVP